MTVYDGAVLTEQIMRFWLQRFDTCLIAKFVMQSEPLVERLLHAEMERRRKGQDEEKSA